MYYIVCVCCVCTVIIILIIIDCFTVTGDKTIYINSTEGFILMIVFLHTVRA